VKFNNGLLVVELRKIIPDHQKLKVYEIQDPTNSESSSDSL
jgi:molecular chaperone IbpA